MCGEAFWKRVVVFCLAFGIGIFVSSLFISKELPVPNTESNIISAPLKKNCVPVDANLGYEKLAQTPDFSSVKEADTKPQAEKQKNEKKSLKSNREELNSAKSQPQFYNPSKDSAEYQNLLHKEKCYELDGRK